MNGIIGMVKIYIFNIRQRIDEKKKMLLLANISPETRKRIERFRLEDDKLRCLYGESIVRMKSSKLLGIPQNEIEISRTYYGKPYIRNEQALSYNLSHSGDWIICAFGLSDVGVDIEQMVSDNEEIVRGFFTPQEIRWWNNSNDKIYSFYQLWTMKESFVKYNGMGLSLSFDQFSVKKHDGVIVVSGEKEEEFQAVQGTLEGTYMYTVCSKEKIDEKLVQLYYNDLLT